MTEIIDLDELVGSPKRVLLGGQEYTLPAQLPVELYLRLRAEEKAFTDAQAAGEEVDDNQRVEDLNDLLLELFRVHQPALDSLPAGLVQLFTIIPVVYGAGSVDEEEDEDPKPKTPARTGKGSTKPRSRAKSRS